MHTYHFHPFSQPFNFICIKFYQTYYMIKSGNIKNEEIYIVTSGVATAGKVILAYLHAV